MKRNKYILLFFLLAAFAGCTDEHYDTGIGQSKSSVTLQLPKDVLVEMKTRALADENQIDDVLVFVFRNGAAKYESFTSPSVNEQTVSFTLTQFSVAEGDMLYVCCNTGVSSVNASSADEFFEQLTYTNAVGDGMVMFGSTSITGSTGNISLQLERVFSKATLICSDGVNSVMNWKICNVPTVGFVSGKSGYPADASFDVTIVPAKVNDAAYFIPRRDNSTGTGNKTFVLVELTGKGWYKLDFYNGTSGIEATSEAAIMDLQRNTHYAFNILSVKSDGYSSEAEAVANTGSNILYNMTVTDNAVTNGQYTLAVDKEIITLYPVVAGQQSLEALNVHAFIPSGSVSDILTYTVRLVIPEGVKQQVWLDGDNDNDNMMDLKRSDEKISTDNSQRTIRLLFDGANIDGYYLEIRLGNLTRQIPLGVLSSNCYLADFATSTGNRIYIPVSQANTDGVARVSKDDNLTFEVIWSDQPDVNIASDYDPDKQWVIVTNNSTFAGNAVLAAYKGDVIVWSWHIWSMDNSVIEYNSKLGIYDFKVSNTKEFNHFTWMDRNLGAYTLEKTTEGSWGMLYQWGRKDPMPGATFASPKSDMTIYYNGTSFTRTSGHPKLGSCFASINNKPNNLEYSIAHPLTFIDGMEYRPEPGASEYDWYSDNHASRNNYLWLDKDQQKAPYNPCPAGWTLPYGGASGPFVGLWPKDDTIIETGGMTFSELGYIPFAPFLDELRAYSTTGAATMHWGNYRDNTMCFTWFLPTEVLTDGNTRASAAHIRCVKDTKDEI